MKLRRCRDSHALTSRMRKSEEKKVERNKVEYQGVAKVQG